MTTLAGDPTEVGLGKRRRRVLIAGVLIVGVAAAVGAARAWCGSGVVAGAGSSVCVPRSSDQPLLVGAAELSNHGPLPVRVESVGLAGSVGLELADGLWAKKLDPAGYVAVGASFSPADLTGYTRVGASGLVVKEGEQWSLVVGVVSPTGGGRLDGFRAVWTRGPFEYRSPSGPELTIVPVHGACG